MIVNDFLNLIKSFFITWTLSFTFDSYLIGALALEVYGLVENWLAVYFRPNIFDLARDSLYFESRLNASFCSSVLAIEEI